MRVSHVNLATKDPDLQLAVVRRLPKDLPCSAEHDQHQMSINVKTGWQQLSEGWTVSAGRHHLRNCNHHHHILDPRPCRVLPWPQLHASR